MRRLDPNRWAVALMLLAMMVAGLRQVRRFMCAHGWDLLFAVAIWLVLTDGGIS